MKVGPGRDSHVKGMKSVVLIMTLCSPLRGGGGVGEQ